MHKAGDRLVQCKGRIVDEPACHYVSSNGNTGASSSRTSALQASHFPVLVLLFAQCLGASRRRILSCPCILIWPLEGLLPLIPARPEAYPLLHSIYIETLR